MSNIRVQNVNGARPQHIRDDNSAAVIANSIASRVSTSSRETVTALSQIQQSGFAGLMSNIDSKNIKLVDLILGRVASLLDEEFAQLSSQDLAKIKADLVTQAASIAATQMTKADKAELQAALTAYFDKKINMKQLELQLAELNVTVQGLQKQLSAGSTAATASPAAAYASTIGAVNSAMKSFSAQFAMVPMQLDAVLQNQQLMLNSINNMYSGINKIYAIVDAMQTKQTWEMIKPFVEPLYKKMYNYIFGLFGAKSPFQEPSAIDTTSTVTEIGKHIDFAAQQIIYAIDTVIERSQPYKYIPYKPVRLREATQLESVVAMVKSFFTGREYEDLINESILGKNYQESELYQQLKENEDQVSALSDSFNVFRKDGDLAKLADAREKLQGKIDENLSRRQREQAEKAEIARQVESTEAIKDVAKKQSIFSQAWEKVTGFFKKIFSGFGSSGKGSFSLFGSSSNGSADAADGGPQKKERSIWDNIKNFFKAIANIADWAANGATGGSVNMWEHFGIGGLPRIIKGIETILYGSDAEKDELLNGVFNTVNSLLVKLREFLNDDGVKNLIDLVRGIFTTENLKLLNNIADAASKIMNSDFMKSMASSKKAGAGAGIKGAASFNVREIIDNYLAPVFDEKHYPQTKSILTNMIDAAKTLFTEVDIPKVIKMVSSIDFDKLIEIKSKIQQLFPKDDSQSKEASAPFDPAQLVEKMEIYAKLAKVAADIIKEVGKSDVLDSVASIIQTFNTQADSIISLIENIDKVYLAFKETAIYKDIVSKSSQNQSQDSKKTSFSFSTEFFAGLKQTVNGIIEIIDHIRSTKLIDIVGKFIDDLNKSSLMQLLVDDSEGSVLSNVNKVFKNVGVLRDTVKGVFGESSTSSSQPAAEQKNGFQLDEIIKYIDDAIVIVTKVSRIVDLISDTKVLDKALLELNKVNGILDVVKSMSEKLTSIFGEKSSKASSGASEPLSKTLDSVTSTVMAVDNLVTNIKTLNLKPLFDTINKYVMQPISKVADFIKNTIDYCIDTVNKVLDVIAKTYNVIAKLINSFIEKINNLPWVNIEWRADENFTFEGFSKNSKKVSEIKSELDIVPQVEAIPPQELQQSQVQNQQIDESLDSISQQSAAESKLVVQTLNDLRGVIDKLSSSSTSSFTDVNANLKNIQAALQALALSKQPSLATSTSD